MAGLPYTSNSNPQGQKALNGGLNSTGGALELQENESSDLQNIDFDKFGSILKRNGYTVFASGTTGNTLSDGLHWFEYKTGGTAIRNLINVSYGHLYQMTNLSGTWADVTSSLTLATGNHCDFENFLNTCFITNGVNPPCYLAGGSTAGTVFANLVANAYNFIVSGITNAPHTGDIYSNNSVNFTFVSTTLTSGAGYLVGTGSGAPLALGTLAAVTTGSPADASIAFTNATASPNITAAKYVKQYNNYLFFANVIVGSTYYPNRIYWSHLNDAFHWDSDQWIEVSKDDGQEITGIRVLQQALVIFKQRAIYTCYFTGDSDIPFILPNGGKSNSTVGCITPFSIQEIENGHVFLAADGLYYFDGNNSYKLSYKITNTLKNVLNTTIFNNGVSCLFKEKNKYMLALTTAGNTTHDRVLVWDYYNNAFSIYVGMAVSAMVDTFTGGFIEQPYFADYNGYTYKMENGKDDYPLGTITAINGYYYTNWKTFDDLCDQKGIAHVYIYYQSSNSVLTFAYSYDFESTDQYTQTLSLSSGYSVYGSAKYGIGTYGGSGGADVRRDLTGRGRTVRFKFANLNLTESMQIDGFGSYVHVETPV